MVLPSHIQKILGKTSQEVFDGTKSNCFWATNYFFDIKAFPPTQLSGIDILRFVSDNFTQVEIPQVGDVFVIWSSSDLQSSPDNVDVHFLSNYPKGFPFGLVVEHSGIILEEEKVFQKASPNEGDIFEIVEIKKAFAPYEKMGWHRKTFHRIKI